MLKSFILPVVAVGVFWAVSSIATTFYLRAIETSHTDSIRRNLAAIRSSSDMRHTLRLVSQTLKSGTHDSSEATLTELERLSAVFEKHLEEAEATSAITGEEAALVLSIRSHFTAYMEEARRQATLTMPTAEDRDQLSRLAYNVADATKRISDANDRAIVSAAESRARVISTLVTVRYGLLVLGPALGVLLGFWLSRRIHRSISRVSITLADVASEIPEGIGRIKIERAGDLPKLQEQVDSVVTRIREVVHELQAARRRAVDAARLAAVGEMAAGVAHELRNPLTSVKLLVQAAAQKPDRTLTARQAEVVVEEILRMERTIERLLDFARPPRMALGRRDLRQVVSNAIRSIEARAAAARVTLRLTSPETPVWVDADTDLLQQVVGNLLANGIEAMPGGGTLRIAIDAKVDGGGVVTSVSDDGPGVSPAIRARLFEPFVTDKPRGTGLGLAISRRVTQDHGGELTCESGDGPGAVFVVRLPASARSPDRQEAGEPSGAISESMLLFNRPFPDGRGSLEPSTAAPRNDTPTETLHAETAHR